MAHFFKAEGMSGAGYDRQLVKQSVAREPGPVRYVTVTQLVSEGAGIGSIVLGGQHFRVTIATKPPDGLPPAAP